MQKLHEHFTYIDWLVVFGYLALTTFVGHLMRGKQGTIRDFFLGGRSLPWLAVTGSIIATEISGVTFIGVPGALFALNGDFTYLQWAIGSILARIVVGMVFVRVYYEQEIYSPYDYMGNRLGHGVKVLATVFFTVGSILAQSVRVMVAALPLKIVTPLPFEWCIIVIAVFAICWTLMGGMQTVIWTDVMQFALFAIGGVIALIAITNSIDGGWDAVIEQASEGGKLKTWNFDWGIGNEFEFTFWVAIIAVPFLNLNAFGVDQLNAQRMFCCRSAKDAKKAIIFSSFGQLLTILMLFVGAALWVYYLNHPPTGEAALEMGYNAADHTVKNGDNVFPIWIVTQLPTGVSGLILAAIFAAAISSLDSILAALSQTTLSLIYHPEREGVQLDQAKLVSSSRILVVVWGLVLAGFTLLLNIANKNVPVLPLAFGMTAYTVGPMLAMFIASLLKKGSFTGLAIGAAISFALTMIVRADAMILIVKVFPAAKEFFASLPTFKLSPEGELKPLIGYFWMWPVSFFITLGFGLLVPNSSPRKS